MASDNQGGSSKGYSPYETRIGFDSTRLNRVGTVGTTSQPTADALANAPGAGSGFTPFFIDGSDAYANKGFVLSFMHIPSNQAVFFKAFVTAFNETYSSDWTEELVYGRADPIMLFKNTTRKISLSFVVPAASLSEGYENLANVGMLSKFLYPMYTDAHSATTIAQSPLVRMKVMNLAQSRRLGSEGDPYGEDYNINHSDPDPDLGLLGAISSLSIAHNLENSDAGVLEAGQGAILPKLIEISLDFSVIHEHAMGWEPDGEGGKFRHDSFPYGTDLKNSESGTSRTNGEKQQANAKVWNAVVEAQKAEARGEEEPNEAQKENAVSRGTGLLATLGRRRSAETAMQLTIADVRSESEMSIYEAEARAEGRRRVSAQMAAGGGTAGQALQRIYDDPLEEASYEGQDFVDEW